MNKITVIGDEQWQATKVKLENGTDYDLEVIYKEQQLGWFASITYGTKVINHIRIVTSENFLHQWRNILPFGIKCETTDNSEPMFQRDFAVGRASLYTLNSDEVDEFARKVSGEITA